VFYYAPTDPACRAAVRDDERVSERALAAGPVLVAVDAGATKSVAVAVLSDGRWAGRAEGGGANPKRHGLGAATATIVSLARDAAEDARPSLILVAGAGIDRPEHAMALESSLRAALPGADVIVVNDTLAALRAGTPDAVGLAVPASTGGNVIGRAADGRVTDRGHGIFGGSYVLGALAARAARRGKGGPGTVGPALAAAVDAAALEWRGRRPSPNAASLGPAVAAAAEAGYSLPARLVDRWCRRVAVAVCEEAGRLALGPAPAVVLYGGMLDASPWLEARLRAAIREGAPGARIARLALEPVDGAVLLALDAWAGRPIFWQFVPRR